MSELSRSRAAVILALAAKDLLAVARVVRRQRNARETPGTMHTFGIRNPSDGDSLASFNYKGVKMRRSLRRIMIIGGSVATATVMFSGTAFASGPSYGWKYANITKDDCAWHLSGGTATGGYAHGDFDADSWGGGLCSNVYLEVIYVDNSGNEVAVHVNGSYNSGDGSTEAQYLLPPSKYRQVLEVLGSATSSLTGANNGGANLYY